MSNSAQEITRLLDEIADMDQMPCEREFPPSSTEDGPYAIRARKIKAILAQPPQAVEGGIELAAIIREVDGNHSLGASELAEAVLAHPRFAALAPKEPAQPQEVQSKT